MSDKLEQLEFKLEKMLGFRNMQEMLEKKILCFLRVEKCFPIVLIEAFGYC